MADLDSTIIVSIERDCNNCDHIDKLFNGQTTCGAFVNWNENYGFFDRDYAATSKEGYGFFEDLIVDKINCLLDDVHLQVLQAYKITEHKDISTIRKSNLNSNFKWHLCGGEVALQGNHNWIKKEIDLCWFNVTNVSKEKRIISKIVTYLHNIQLAYQSTVLKSLWEIKDIFNTLNNHSIFENDSIFSFTENFFYDEKEKIEEMFDIKITDDLINYFKEENEDVK